MRGLPIIPEHVVNTAKNRLCSECIVSALAGATIRLDGHIAGPK